MEKNKPNVLISARGPPRVGIFLGWLCGICGVEEQKKWFTINNAEQRQKQLWRNGPRSLEGRKLADGWSRIPFIVSTHIWQRQRSSARSPRNDLGVSDPNSEALHLHRGVTIVNNHSYYFWFANRNCTPASGTSNSSSIHWFNQGTGFSDAWSIERNILASWSSCPGQAGHMSHGLKCLQLVCFTPSSRKCSGSHAEVGLELSSLGRNHKTAFLLADEPPPLSNVGGCSLKLSGCF